MELKPQNLDVLGEVQQLLADEGFKMYDVEVGSRFEPRSDNQSTEISCTIVEE